MYREIREEQVLISIFKNAFIKISRNGFQYVSARFHLFGNQHSISATSLVLYGIPMCLYICHLEDVVKNFLGSVPFFASLRIASFKSSS